MPVHRRRGEAVRHDDGAIEGVALHRQPVATFRREAAAEVRPAQIVRARRSLAADGQALQAKRLQRRREIARPQGLVHGIARLGMGQTEAQEVPRR